MDYSRFADRARDRSQFAQSRFQMYEDNHEDLGLMQDYPMDEFDKQLIGEQSLQQPHLRYSLPSQPIPPVAYSQNHRSLRDDLLSMQQDVPASSSPSFAIYSPTASILHNKSQAKNRPRKAVSHKYHHISTAPKTNLAHKGWSDRMAPKSFAKPFGQLHTTPVIQNIPLIPTDKLPDHMRSIFSFELFNAVQSKCFSAAFDSNDNMVVSAPTGSGKTVIMELALCRLIMSNKNQDWKAIYQAPTKSLCSERCQDWAKKFSTLGLKCAELTGDTDSSHLKNVQSAQIIVTTPEKWDSVTRKWRDNAKLMQMIKLFLVDEVHILNESRGATLEAIVSRMKTVGSGVRLIALSATVPNSDDIATWLGRSPSLQHLPAYREVFDEAFRPVKLQKHVIGYNNNGNTFALDNTLTKEIPSIVARYGNRKPIMIFCVSKKSASSTANILADLWASTAAHLRLWKGPQRPVNVSNVELQKLLPAGVAVHHGSLDAADRRTVEQCYLSGEINIICSTSTLAVGVNLPCYLVILKGTSCWGDNGIQEYSSLEVMQMLGRAGRPQYETSACAVILTNSSKVRHYEEMVSSQETLESSLHKNLIEHLNAEIGIGTVFNGQSAKKWLASSFLSVRLRQNPKYYHLEGQIATDDADRLLEQICERDLKLLEDAELIEHCNGKLQSTEYGDAMARYYVNYESMVVFLKMPQKPKISEILTVLAQAHEFRDLRVRGAEKSMYKEMNKANDIRYPIKVDIALPVHKTSLIIQAHLGGVIINRSNTSRLGQDTAIVMNHCNRLIRCIIDIQIHRKDGAAVKNALELCRSMAAGVWDNTAMQLKQIETIGDVTARKLAAAGIGDIDTLINTEPHRLQVVLGKTQPFGSILLGKAAKFPNLRISVKEIGRIKKGRSGKVEVCLNCEIGYLNESLPAFFNRKAVHVCFLCETSDGTLVDFSRFDANRLKNGEKILLTAQLEKNCSFLNCHVMCDEIAGTHRRVELTLDIPSTWFPSTPVQEVPKAVASRVRNSQFHLEDDFDDSDLRDDDFLAAELALDQIDLVDEDVDIDQVMQGVDEFVNTPDKSNRPTAILDHDSTQGVTAKEYHTPKRLANGKWTCQHTCSEEGKECKHACCKEGVKRPKKRPKTESAEPKANDTIEKAFTKPSKKSQALNGIEIPDIDDILSENAMYRASVGLPKEAVSTNKVHSGNPAQQATSKHSTTKDFLLGVGELDSDDLPTIDTIASHSNLHQTDPSSQVNAGIQGGTQASFGHISDLDLDPMDCDWYDTAVIPSHPGIQALEDASGAVLNEVFTSESDSSNELFKLDLTKSSSVEEDAPVKSGTASHSQAIDMTGDDLFSEDFFEGIDDADLAMVNEIHTQSASLSMKESVNEQGAIRINLQTVPDAKRYVDIFVMNPEDILQEEQRRQRHEEEQKRKWSKFPAWMYEDFGAYVNIV